MSPGWPILLLVALAQAPGDAGREVLAERLHRSLVVQGKLLETPLLDEHLRRRLPVLAPGRRLQVAVLDHPRPGAFALPPDRVYLTLALFVSVSGQSELDFVLAHEIAHLALDHHKGRGKRSQQQRAADAWALDALALGGVDEVPARSLLGFLAGLGTDERLVALPDGAEAGPRIPGLDRLRRLALDRRLAVGEWQTVRDCLDSACGDVLDDADRNLLRAVALRLSGRPGDALALLAGAGKGPAVERERALAMDWDRDCEAAQAAWRNSVGHRDGPAADWPDCEVACRPVAREHRRRGNGVGIGIPDSAATIDPAPGWVARNEGDALTMTRDGWSVQTLRIRRISNAPAAPGPALDQALRDWRLRHPGRLGRVVSSRPRADGLSMELLFTDSRGLGWRVGLIRIAVGGETLEAEFTAPSLFHYGRDRPAVVSMLDSLS